MFYFSLFIFNVSFVFCLVLCEVSKKKKKLNLSPWFNQGMRFNEKNYKRTIRAINRKDLTNLPHFSQHFLFKIVFFPSLIPLWTSSSSYKRAKDSFNRKASSSFLVCLYKARKLPIDIGCSGKGILKKKGKFYLF